MLQYWLQFFLYLNQVTVDGQLVFFCGIYPTLLQVSCYLPFESETNIKEFSNLNTDQFENTVYRIHPVCLFSKCLELTSEPIPGMPNPCSLHPDDSVSPSKQ